jgi:hypothetical protein
VFEKRLGKGERSVFSILLRRWHRKYLLVLYVAALVALGCQTTPFDQRQAPASLRTPRPGEPAESFEDSLTGGQVFSMYCDQCHIARPLAERPFLNYENVMAHMRARANLSGQEYAKLIDFLQRFHDVPSPSGPVEPAQTRTAFPQPIAELRPAPPAEAQPAEAPPEAGGAADALPPAIP